MKTIPIDTIQTKSAFEAFFRSHYGAMCRFAEGFTHDADDAEEVVQQCFVKLWEGREDIKISTSPKAYLYQMIRNACLNQKKHIQIREDYKVFNEEERSVPEEENSSTDGLKEKLHEAIRQMPPQRRKIFELSRFEGLTYKEIAAHLDISPKTVENHMGSAMKELRVALKGYLHISFVIYFIDGVGDYLIPIVLVLGA